MKRNLLISTTFDQPELLRNMVERLADRRYDIGFANEKMPGGWEALETSSTETYVSGTTTIDSNENDSDRINMPFITCFMFTCSKGKDHPYQLNWSASLS